MLTLSLLHLINFTKSLYPDQDRYDLGPNCLTLMVFLKDFFNINFGERKKSDSKKNCKINSVDPDWQRVL